MAQAVGSEWLTNLQFVTVETFIIQFIILLIVLWVLNKFVFRPYLAYLDEWEAKQAKVKADYDNADAIVAEKTRQGDEILEKARMKWNAVIEEAESLAKTKKDRIISEAEKSASEVKHAAMVDIEKQKDSMLSGVKSQVIDMALKLNGKIFKDQKASKDFLEKHIDSL